MAAATSALLAVTLAATPPGGPAAEAPSPAAVYRLHPRVDALVMGAAALAISVPTLLAADIVRERCPCDRSSVNRFDRGAIGNHDDTADVVSTVTALAAMAAPPLADLALLGEGETLYADLAIFAETLLVNGALVEIAKYAVQRPLPRTYAGDPDLVHQPGGYRSFYSGHTSTTFAALVSGAYTARLRYGERLWPWLVALGGGASVGVERVLAGRHFPSDVLVGAAAGIAVGLGVPWLHESAHRAAIVPAQRGIVLAVAF